MKYVMLEIKIGDSIQHFPIIFPAMLVHKDMADMITSRLRREHNISDAVSVSAGFITIDECSVADHSESLNLKSAAKDEETIEQYNYYHGIQV